MSTLDSPNRSKWRQFLRQVPFLAGLNEAAFEQVASACVRRELPAKTSLFYEGDEGYCLYVLGKGTIQIRKETASTPLVVAELHAGDVIGELALLDGQPRSATAITTTPCTLYELSRDRFLRCIQDHPELALAMVAVLTQRLREANEQLAHRQMPVETRLVAQLVARLALQPEPQIPPVLLGKLTNAELGRHLSTTRETISRKMDTLLQQGIVKRDTQGLWVLHPQQLQRFLKENA